MWEKVKSDPLIKTVVVIVLGVLAFGFAFNIMFGSGSSSMEEGSMMGSGYSLNNMLGNVIELLIKLVIIALLIGVIVWLFRAIAKPSERGQKERFSLIKEDSFIKNTLIISGSVVVLLLAFNFLKRILTGLGGEGMDSSSSNMFLGASFGFTSLASFLLKVLIIIFIIVLGYVIIMYFKENYTNVPSPKENDMLQAESKECPDCKAKVKEGWKCCPYCGSDKVSNMNE